MRKQFLALLVSLGMILSLIGAPLADAQTSSPNGFKRWTDTSLRFGTVSGSAYLGQYGVTLRDDKSGTWTSPPVGINPIDTLNPSWQAITPPGSSVNSELRIYNSHGWSPWFQMGLWTFGNTPVRTSTNGQKDLVFGRVFTDTYVNTTNNPVRAYQTRMVLNASGNNRPVVRQVAVQAATTRAFTQVSPTTMRHKIDLPVPRLSQYVLEGAYPAYGGGGEAWCSPTGIAMVLRYYGTGPSDSDINALPPDPVLDSIPHRANGEAAYAAIHTYDTAYEGTGNWPFNTAYAAHYNLDTAVRVFPDLRSIEAEIKRGNPVEVSIAWDNTNANPSDDLPGTGIARSDGHLIVIRGFTANGDVITNDPATHAGNSDVRRVYNRVAFERQWLNASNGTAYTFARR